VKLRDVGADETDRIERKRKKKNPDQGFAGVWSIVKKTGLFKSARF